MLGFGISPPGLKRSKLHSVLASTDMQVEICQEAKWHHSRKTHSVRVKGALQVLSSLLIRLSSLFQPHTQLGGFTPASLSKVILGDSFKSPTVAKLDETD